MSACHRSEIDHFGWIVEWAGGTRRKLLRDLASPLSESNDHAVLVPTILNQRNVV